MLEKIAGYLGVALLLGGYFWMKASRGMESLGTPVVLMGAGAVLLLYPGYRLSVSLSGAGAAGANDKLRKLLAKDRLNFLCALAVVAGIAGLQLSPGGVNRWTVGFTGLALGAGALYAVGYALHGGAAAAANVARIAFGACGFMGLIVSGVTLIFQLSGASDMPDRWNVYALYGFLGLAASCCCIYYGMAYQVNLDLLETLEPLGFRPAESGPLSRDGKYDARGLWKGTDTLVNVDQNPGHKSSAPTFSLQIRCELKRGGGRRLLAHPGGVFRRPLGAPFTLPRAEGPGEWADFSVGCEPPEAAAALLSALGSPSARGLTEGAGFSGLLLEAESLTLWFSGDGYPSLNYLRGKLDAAVSAAAALEGAPGAGLPY